MEVSGTYMNSPKGLKGEELYDFGVDTIPRGVLNSDAIILNLPPRFIKSEQELVRFLKAVSDKKIIFVSSTSVYGNQGTVDEFTPPCPETASGEFLLRLENAFQAVCPQGIVIRPGGLYGEDRHPGKYLAGKTVESLVGDKINLISGNDLVALVHKAMEFGDKKLINAVNSNHPSKAEYYRGYCQRHGLPVPEFKINPGDGKVVLTAHKAFIVDSKLP